MDQKNFLKTIVGSIASVTFIGGSKETIVEPPAETTIDKVEIVIYDREAMPCSVACRNGRLYMFNDQGLCEFDVEVG